MRTERTAATSGIAAALAALFLISAPARGDLPQAGDVVFGANRSDATTTLQLLRGPAAMNGGAQVASPWLSQPFIEIVKFDNFGGVSHNASGNLLGVNFGTADVGGQVFSFATTGSDPTPTPEIIVDPFNSVGGAVTPSRLGIIAVSPDNTKLAVTTYETAGLLGYDYAAGNTMGSGASSSNGHESAPYLVASRTQGIAWKDNSTIITFSSDAKIYESDYATLTPTLKATLPQPVDSGTSLPIVGNFTSLAYNPGVSPYVYALWGGFSSATTNKLWVLDPDNSYNVVKTVDLSLSLQTAREIAIGPDGNLFMTQFSGPQVVIDFIPGANALNPASLTDNSSIDWYVDAATTGVSFSGLDVGFGATAPLLDADFDSNQTVNGDDLALWNGGYGTATGAGRINGDANGDGAVSGADFLIWQRENGMSSSVAAINAVPEPATCVLTLGALAMACAAGALRAR